MEGCLLLGIAQPGRLARLLAASNALGGGPATCLSPWPQPKTRMTPARWAANRGRGNSKFETGNWKFETGSAGRANRQFILRPRSGKMDGRKKIYERSHQVIENKGSQNKLTEKKRTFWFKCRTFWSNVVTFWRGHAAFPIRTQGRFANRPYVRIEREEGDGPFPTYRCLAFPQSEPPRL